VKPETQQSTPGVLVILFALLLAVPPARTCEPASFFLFRDEARVRLDSLSAAPDQENVIDRLVLMHNLAFHKDKEQRERAEKFLDKQFPKKTRSALIRAYMGSLRMIKVSHRTTGSKVLRTINPLTKSPRAEAREGYGMISEVVESDSSNTLLRLLRVTAAAESAEHLHELFDSAKIDLEWLAACTDPSDSVYSFFVHLNWAKYHHKLFKMNGAGHNREEAERHVKEALEYSCTPVYRQWALEWRERIFQATETE
jgi:hypothetical protein